MPGGAAVVVLLLNGLQIALPGPAFLEDDRVWIPARAVLEAAGFQVAWDANRNCLTAEKSGWVGRIDVAEARVQSGDRQMHAMEARPREIGGLLYVPAAAFRHLLFGVDFNAPRRTLSLVTARFGGAGLAPRSLLDRPLDYLGTQVTVSGESGGPAERLARGSDAVVWVLRDAYASIVCHSPLDDGQIAWNPRHGLRVEVRGRLGMASDGSLYIQVAELRELDGVAAVACELATDRLTYTPGTPVLIELYVSNPTNRAIDLASGRRAGLSVADTSNRVLWEQWVDLPAALAPGELVEYSFLWEAPEQTGAGRDGVRECVLELHSNAGMWAVRRWFRVGGAQTPAGRIAENA